MKMKGFIAVLLCVVMLTATVAPAVFADDVEINIGEMFPDDSVDVDDDTDDSGKVSVETVDPTKDDNETEEAGEADETGEAEEAEDDFPDVKKEDWFYSDVKELVSMGVVKGHDTGLFDPHGNVTRAEFIKMVVASLIKEDQMAYSTSKVFEDVTVDDWYYDYVITAIFYGFINPKDYGTHFNPDEAITRREVANIIVTALRVEKDNYKTPFADADDWKITSLYGLCLMQGELDPETGARNFKPDTNIERCEVSAVILRMYKLVTDKEAFFADFYENNPTYQKLELLYAPQNVAECYTELTNAWGNSQAFLTYNYEYSTGSVEMSDIKDSFYQAFI